jgi:DDE superfamily endonuclease
MKKVFASIGSFLICWQLAGCNSIPTKDSASSTRSPTTPQSFAQWCEQKKAVPAATKHTIEVLLQKAGTNDCQLADRKLSSLKTLDINAITTLIEAVGAKVINLSPYSPDFNPIEHRWSQLKAFIKTFSPKTTKMVDTLISVALQLINPLHLRNWFSNCCYCTS